MTFSNLVKKFYKKANISKNVRFVYNYNNFMEINPDCNEHLKDLNIKNQSIIFCYFS